MHFTPIVQNTAPSCHNLSTRTFPHFTCDLLHSFFFFTIVIGRKKFTSLYLFQVPAAVSSIYDLLYGTIAIPLLLLRVISLIFWEQNDELQETFGRLMYSAGAVLSRTLDFDYRHGDELYEYPITARGNFTYFTSQSQSWFTYPILRFCLIVHRAISGACLAALRWPSQSKPPTYPLP